MEYEFFVCVLNDRIYHFVSENGKEPTLIILAVKTAFELLEIYERRCFNAIPVVKKISYKGIRIIRSNDLEENEIIVI